MGEAAWLDRETGGWSEGEGAQDVFKGRMHSTVYLALVIPSILH